MGIRGSEGNLFNSESYPAISVCWGDKVEENKFFLIRVGFCLLGLEGWKCSAVL